jgi:cell division septation protein DedD
MTDIRADDDIPLEGEDRLPWLEAVDDDEEGSGPSSMKMLVSVVVGLIAIGLIVGGLFWIGDRTEQAAGPEVIEAQQGDYKVRPDDPGGMKVEGSGETSFAASEGALPKGTINVDAVPEAPVTKAAPPPPLPKTAPAPQPSAAPAPQAKAAPAAAPRPAGPVAGSQQIQLGAFSSASGAQNAWKVLSGRFKYLEPLSHGVMPVTVNGRTLHRLRASGPNADQLCGRLRVAGETCVSID